MTDKWDQLKQILKNELARLENELFTLQDLKMQEHKNGLYEKEFNQHNSTICYRQNIISRRAIKTNKKK